jgi:flagellar biosynthesis anti-sigma factor FlgM
MKIETGRPNADAIGTQRVDQNGVDRTTRTGRRSDTGDDSIRLSPDAQLATAAAREAASSPEIRQDKVEAARKALAAGQVGNDTLALADSIIDSLLEN